MRRSAGPLTDTLVSLLLFGPTKYYELILTLHAAADVNIYASSSKDAWPLVGNNENTDVGAFLADYLDLDVDAVTKRLKSAAYWTASGEESTT